MSEARLRRSHKKNNVFTYILLTLLVLSHLAVLAFILLSSRYYAVDLKMILMFVAFILVLFIITDIICYVGVRHNDKPLKIISTILASLLLIVFLVATFYVYSINTSVDNVLDNSGDEQFEKVSGTFVSYKKSFADLGELNNKKVGVLYETNEGTGSIGQEELASNGVQPLIVQFNTMDDLLFGLIGEEVDAAIFPSSYRQRYTNDEEVDFERYLDDLHDFYSFEKEIKTGENQGKKINLSAQPFNILLIGFAPETADNSYGLADSIIVATVNPGTMRVSLTSIARDSYVPISCYGGAKDKINAARGNSRACLIDTVNQMLGTDISLYMEVNFQGVVAIVDALGGIMIDNPVEFVGQTPSATRGEMRVFVPAGQYVATGEQALAFARERHHMPNGDFDRQIHQQEVIQSIAQKLIELRDVNAALKVMEAAGENISTNLSITQLTGIFNYILNVKNYSGAKTSQIITIDNMRVTGYPSWTYNYSLHLPLWIYKLYNGSITEAKNYINEILGNVDMNTVKADQKRYQRFFANFPYYRDTLYSEYFNEEQVHEKMPDFVPKLTNYTYDDALAWANSMGVTLSVTTINQNDPGFDADLSGSIIDQNPRQGALVMENPVVYVTMMGYEKREITIDCTTYEEALELAKKYNLTTQVSFVENDGTHEAWDLFETSPKLGETFEEGAYNSLAIYVYDCPKGQEMNTEGKCYVPHEHSWGDWQVTKEPTCLDAGERTRTCKEDATHVQTEVLNPLGHDWGDWQVTKEPTTTENGSQTRTCKRDPSHVETQEIPVLSPPEPTPEPAPEPTPEPAPEPAPEEPAQETGGEGGEASQ